MIFVAFLLYQKAMAELVVGDNLTATTGTPIIYKTTRLLDIPLLVFHAFQPGQSAQQLTQIRCRTRSALASCSPRTSRCWRTRSALRAAPARSPSRSIAYNARAYYLARSGGWVVRACQFGQSQLHNRLRPMRGGEGGRHFHRLHARRTAGQRVHRTTVHD